MAFFSVSPVRASFNVRTVVLQAGDVVKAADAARDIVRKMPGRPWKCCAVERMDTPPPIVRDAHDGMPWREGPAICVFD